MKANLTILRDFYSLIIGRVDTLPHFGLTENLRDKGGKTYDPNLENTKVRGC